MTRVYDRCDAALRRGALEDGLLAATARYTPQRDWARAATDPAQWPR